MNKINAAIDILVNVTISHGLQESLNCLIGLGENNGEKVHNVDKDLGSNNANVVGHELISTTHTMALDDVDLEACL